MALCQINMDTDSEDDEERQQGKDKEGNVEEEDVGEEDAEMAKGVHAAEHMHLRRRDCPEFTLVELSFKPVEHKEMPWYRVFFIAQEDVELMDEKELEAAFKASITDQEAISRTLSDAPKLDAARAAAASSDKGAGVASSKGKRRLKLRKQQRGVAEQRKLDAQVAALEAKSEKVNQAMSKPLVEKGATEVAARASRG
eukprot:882521-Pleurochrysis_carterae.AAC.1